MRKAMRPSSRKGESSARLTMLGPDSVACSPISAHAATSTSGKSAYDVHSLRLPSFSSTTSIASSSTHSTVAPLSKMFSLPSRPSMRRLVPSPSMPSLRIDLRRERSRSELRSNDERHLSTSPPEQERPLSTVPPVAETSTTTLTTGPLSKLHGARQMLFSSTRRRSERSSTSTRKSGESVIYDGFWQPPSMSSIQDSKAGASPVSIRSDILASPPPRIVEPQAHVTSTRATSDEARRDSTSTQTTVGSPPMVERILPPEEIIATIDRMRKEQRAAAAAAAAAASAAGLGDSTLGLGLSGVQVHEANTATAGQQYAQRSRPSYSGRRPSTSMSVDESFFSRSSSSSPFWSDDGKVSAGPLSPSRSPTASNFSMSASNKNAISPVVELYYTNSSSTTTSSSISNGGVGGGGGTGSNSSTPNLLDMPSSSMASPSHGQPRSLPVPPRMGKKSRSYANGLNALSVASGAQSPMSVSRTSMHSASPNLSRLASSQVSVQSSSPSPASPPATAKTISQDIPAKPSRSLSPSKKPTHRFVERSKDVHDSHDEEDKENTFARSQDAKSNLLTESKSNCSVENCREVQHSSSTNSFGIRQEHNIPPSSADISSDGNMHVNADLTPSMSALTLAPRRMPVTKIY